MQARLNIARIALKTCIGLCPGGVLNGRPSKFSFYVNHSTFGLGPVPLHVRKSDLRTSESFGFKPKHATVLVLETFSEAMQSKD